MSEHIVTGTIDPAFVGMDKVGMSLTRKEIEQRYRERHKERLASEAAARREAWRAAGLCAACGSQRESADAKQCEACRAKSRKWSIAKGAAKKIRDAEKYASRKAAGLCVQCAAPVVSGIKCEKHREDQRIKSLIFTRANPHKVLDRHLRSKYGITIEQRQKMLEAQRGTCAICGSTDPGGRFWNVDHDHATGALRELLCTGCNQGLGCFRDNPAVMELAIAYLVKHKKGAVG